MTASRDGHMVQLLSFVTNVNWAIIFIRFATTWPVQCYTYRSSWLQE